jgi:MFS family permease
MLDEASTQKALRMSIYDGAFATMMASLAGGIFLVGFALNVLGANSLQIGILAALPVSANLAQLLGSILLETLGQRRRVCLIAVTAARLFWIPVLLLPFALFDGFDDGRVWLLVAFVGVSCLLGSLSGVAWLEWMSDVIPKKTRGAYLGKRNMVCAGAGMVVTLAGGAFLNFMENRYGREDPLGYIILFGIGLVLGLAASFFLFRVPDPKAKLSRAGEDKFKLNLLLQPLRDSSFRRIVFCVGFFMLVTQVAGPFYAVFMIENLSVDFGTITWLITFATLATIFMLRIWGPISDTLGNKPVMFVAGAFHAFIPLIWVVAQPGNFLWPLILAHVASGAIYCAIILAHTNILIKSAPEKGRSVYIAVFNGIIGLMVAVAPILGGWLLELMSSWSVQVGEFRLENLQFLFLLSGGLQLIALVFVLRVREEGAMESRVVLMQLGNDLNPQTGLASATDFVLVKANKSAGLMKSVNTKLDQWADRSEQRVAATLHAIERPFSRPWQTVKKLYHDDPGWGSPKESTSPSRKDSKPT